MELKSTDTLELSQRALQELLALAECTALEDMKDDEAHVCRLVGLFFAANPEFAAYAIDIETLTLTPRQEHPAQEENESGKEGRAPEYPYPMATVVVKRKGQEYRLTTDSAGHLPRLPFGRGLFLLGGGRR